jgi:hypothetical protein
VKKALKAARHCAQEGGCGAEGMVALLGVSPYGRMPCVLGVRRGVAVAVVVVAADDTDRPPPFTWQWEVRSWHEP